MKKITFLVVTLLATVMMSFGQGLEDFTNSNATGSYTSNSFVGNNGITWTYVASRNGNNDANSSGINLPAVMLRRSSDDSKITSSTITGGISNFSVKLYKGFTGADNRQVELFVNGISYGKSEEFDDFNLHTFSVNDINVAGDVIIEIKNVTEKQVIIDDITWTAFNGTATPSVMVSSPSEGQVFTPGTTNVNLEFNISNATGSETVDVTVNGTKTTGASSPFAITTADGQTYNVTVELLDDSNTVIETKTVNFSVDTIQIAPDIAALRAVADSKTYSLTGEVIVTGLINDDKVNSRNQKFIQDNTAGILIDDDNDVLAAFNLQEGDKILGLVGTVYEHRGTTQFIPNASSNVTVISQGNTIAPQEITVAELRDNGENYESELIKVTNLRFDGDDENFGDNKNYSIIDASDNSIASVCRIRFDGITNELPGTDIPTTTVSISGFGGEYNGTYQVYPRTTTDIVDETLSVSNNNVVAYKLYPNPAHTVLNIAAKGNINVSVYNAMGQKVLTTTNKTVNIETLTSGIYFVQVAQKGASLTRKLIIE